MKNKPDESVSLEDMLREIHESTVASRDAANDVLAKLAKLRQWMTEQEIQRLRTQLKD